MTEPHHAADSEIRRDLHEFLKDEIVYLLQKNVTHEYKVPGLPPASATRRYNIHLLKSLRVYVVHTPGKDFSREGLIGRWYSMLGRRRPMNAAQAVAYFTILRHRLHSLGENVPYTFSDLTRLVEEVVRDDVSSLGFDDVYMAEVFFRREFEKEIADQFGENPDWIAGAMAIVEDLSHKFIITVQNEIQKHLQTAIRRREIIHSEVLEQKLALDEEIRHAARLHNKSLQKELPRDDPRVSFHLWYEPSSMVGGDFYRVIRTSQNTYALFLADIAGHGVSAAMYILSVKSCFEKFQDYLDRPADMLAKMNDELYGRLADNFLTAICAHVNLAEYRIDYCNAGHPKAFLVLRGDPNAIRVKFLRPNSKVIGIFHNAEYRADSVDFENNSRLALYTDGITETMNEQGEMLDERGLLDLFEGTTSQDGEPTIAHVRTALRAFQKKGKADDDRSLILADLLPR